MHKYFNIISLIIILTLSSIIGCRAKREDKVVAQVGDKVITLGDFEQRYKTRTFPTEEEEKEAKLKILNSMIEQKLFAIAGEEENLAEEIDENLKDYPDRLAVAQLYEEVVVKRAKVSGPEIKRTYKMMGRELHGRHILCRTKEDAEALYSELIKNNAKDFAELAKNSLDPKTSNKGGDMGWFSWGRMSPEHQEVAYSLKIGKISKPFETRMGWDILQIVDERERKMRSLEEEKEMIENTLKRQKLNDLANNFLEKLKKRAKIDFDTTVISLFLEKTPEAKQQAPFTTAPLPVFSEEEGKKVIATSSLGAMTISELVDKAQATTRRPPLNSRDAIIGYIEGDLVNQLLIEQAKRMHLQKSPEVMKKFNDTRDNRIAGEFRKKFVVFEEEITEEEMKTYYKENKENYKVDEKRDTRIVVVETKEEADKIYKTVIVGGDIQRIAEKQSIHYTKNRNGALGPSPKTKFPEGYGEKAFSLRKGEISKPFETKDGFVVMKLVKIEPATYTEYEKVKNRIKNEIRNNKIEKIKSDIVDKLKQDTHVYINEDVLLMAGKTEKG